MMSQRVGMSALRRVAKPSPFLAQTMPKVASTSILTTVHTRAASTEKLTPADANTILAEQRLRRPVSPHLTIYKLDQTWFGGSIWTRFTGGFLSAGLYGFSFAYLAAPLLGWHLETQSLAAAFAALPIALKGGIKFAVAWPFTYHFINGIRHLVYDLGKGFTKATFKTQGWAIWGASLVTGLYFAFLY